MRRWYVLLQGSHADLAHIKRLFTASGFLFDHIDGSDSLSTSALELLDDTNDVIDAGMELLASINTALRLSVPGYSGLQFHGVAEKKNGKTHRTMLAEGASYAFSGAAIVAIAGTIGKPIRSKEERLVSLLAKRPEIADLASALATRPLTWSAMNTTYESVKGLMSTKATAEAKRQDHQGLIDRGWITADDSKRFYKTAGYHRHGYPKTPIRDASPMEYHEASILIKRLFWRLVDELEPI